MDTSAGSLGTRSRDPISGALLGSSECGSDRRDAGAAATPLPVATSCNAPGELGSVGRERVVLALDDDRVAGHHGRD